MSAVLVEFPSEIIEEIDKIVGNGNHSAFLLEMAQRQIKLHRQRAALHDAAGCWKSEDHPELEGGSDAFVRWLRSLDQARMDEIEAHRNNP